MRERTVETMPGGNSAGHRSTAEIIQDIVGSLGNIVRSELRLARVEMTDKARKAGSAGGMMAGGFAILAVAGLLFIVACVAALSLIMPVWLAALLVGIVLACVGGYMAIAGRNRLKRVEPKPVTAINSVKEDVEWLKHSIK